jgi:hypothetical protein
MTFTRTSTQPEKVSIVTSGGLSIEKVSSFKYQGIWLDDMTFKVHLDNLVRKLKLKLEFYFCNKACFPLMARKQIDQATFLFVIDYGDLLYMHAASSVMHPYSLLQMPSHSPTNVGWTSLNMRRKLNLYVFIYKALTL